MSRPKAKEGTTLVRIGMSVHRLLKIEAAKRGVPMARLAEAALREALKKSG